MFHNSDDMKKFSNLTPAPLLIALSVAIFWTSPALPQSGGGFDVTWDTIDGGGIMFTTGGDFKLGGTLGQPDAVELSGGVFTLNGGFWSAAPECVCLSDVNNDGDRNGKDIQEFIGCILAGGPDCVCADLDEDGFLDLSDVSMFVSDLLTGATCP